MDDSRSRGYDDEDDDDDDDREGNDRMDLDVSVGWL